MRRALPLILLLLTVPSGGRLVAQTIAAGDSAQPSTVERLLVVADMERMYASSLESGIAAQLKANPALAAYEDLLRAFMAKYVSYADLKPELYRTYRESFSEVEMQELIRFYESDFGRRLMAKMPALMARSSQWSASRLKEHLPELMAQVQERMTAPAAQ